MSETIIFVGLWIGLSWIIAILWMTKRIKETTLVGWVAFSIGVGLTWAMHGGDRNAAAKWRDGGMQVAIACAHTPQCVAWLGAAPSIEGIHLPGEVFWLRLCDDKKGRSLFGKAVPCVDNADN